MTTIINEPDRALLVNVIEQALTSAECYHAWLEAADLEQVPERDRELHRMKVRLTGLRSLMRRVRMTPVVVA